MSVVSAEAATVGLAQGRCGDQSDYVVSSESAYVVVAVVVELYNASAAAAAVAPAAVVPAAVCAVSIPFPAPSARFPLCHVHPART
jgi:hypothetical protein